MNPYLPRTAERDAEIAAALAAYEGATTLTERLNGYALCEQFKNAEALMHRTDECDRIHREMIRIGKDTSVVDAMDALSPFSKANWAAAKAARNTKAAA